jgi:quercetin dioxygenase-like cupin family protein
MEPGATLPLHTHTVEDTFVVLSGTGKFTLGDETFSLEPGMAVLAPAGVKHGCTNDSDEPLVIIFMWPAVNVERQLA